ncbi:MAG: hypothetical protein J0H59_05560 [Comamonadaceae bacterium]|nr:hypothetical protein [Comamonadaceae bacterium]
MKQSSCFTAQRQNPEEKLNAEIKREMGKRVQIRTKARLHEAANEHMSTLMAPRGAS